MPAIDLNHPDPELVLAGTCWGEARGGGMPAMGDVACVILNRVRGGWAKDIPGACLARWQFSCWNAADPNRARILAVAAADRDPAWLTARSVARLALAGGLRDRTGGADSYFATSMPAPPYWAKPPARHTATWWLHSFWRVRPARAAPPSSARIVSAQAELPDADDGEHAWT